MEKPKDDDIDEDDEDEDEFGNLTVQYLTFHFIYNMTWWCCYNDGFP